MDMYYYAVINKIIIITDLFRDCIQMSEKSPQFIIKYIVLKIIIPIRKNVVIRVP